MRHLCDAILLQYHYQTTASTCRVKFLRENFSSSFDDWLEDQRELIRRDVLRNFMWGLKQ